MSGARELLLYELGQRDPRAHVDEHGQVWARAEGYGPSLLVDEMRMERGGLLPRVLFADVPVPLHLTAGVMLAPISEADADTGPEGLHVQRQGESVAGRTTRAFPTAPSARCACGGTAWEDAEAGGRCINCGVAHPNMSMVSGSDLQRTEQLAVGDPCEFRYPARSEWRSGHVASNGAAGYWSVCDDVCDDESNALASGLYIEHIRAVGTDPWGT